MICTLACVAAAAAQDAPSLVTSELKPGVYLVEGGGSNSGFVVGDSGVVVIDAKGTADEGRALVAEVAKVTPKPITHVVLTHSDADHVNGLTGFPQGVTVIAHENARREMEAAAAAGAGGLPAAWLPTATIARTGDTQTIHGIAFELRHWAPAHTSGDLAVVIPSARLVFTGGITASRTPDPVIHRAKRGSTEGWITTVKGLLGYSVQFVPGHGHVQTRTEVQSILTAVSEKRDWIVSLAREGKSLDEIKRTVGEPASPDAPKSAPAPPTFTDVVYQEVGRRR